MNTNLTEILTQLRDDVYNDAKEMGIHGKDYPDSHWLMPVLADIAAAAKAEEAGERVNQYGYDLFAREDDDNEDFAHNYSCFIKGTMEDKMASACIRILDFMGLKGYTVAGHMEGYLDFATALLGRSAAFGEVLTFGEVMLALAFSLTKSYEGAFAWINSTLVTIFAYCVFHGINISKYIELRMAYNKISE